MSPRGPWGRLLWGPWTIGAAVLILSLASAATGDNRWWWITPAAIFVFAHTIVRAVSDQSVTQRLGQDYDRVLHRVLRLVADLADLAGEKYELWMVDLYLPSNSWHLRRQRWWLHRTTALSRELSISLADSRPQPPAVSLSGTPHGDCYTRAHRLMWRTSAVSEGNLPAGVAAVSDDGSVMLENGYGVLLLAPLVDQLGKHCNGIMAIHVGPDTESALQARGVLTSARGLRKIEDACTEINGFLQR